MTTYKAVHYYNFLVTALTNTKYFSTLTGHADNIGWKPCSY